MKAGVVVFPGSNCDRDMKLGLESAGFDVTMLWHKDATIPKLDIIVLPGGFSYGDYLRCGAIAAHSNIIREVKKHANEGRLVLGVCNGFQILCESGLLPGVLMSNKSLKFICNNQQLKVESNDNVFTKKYKQGEQVTFPIAHHDGNYFADGDTLKTLQDNGQVAFTYTSNPNGAVNNIAGITNEKGNVLGMMPHPERAVSPELGGIDGKRFFKNLLD
jgi:phosphoribosylformylglycinamidine synthase I